MPGSASTKVLKLLTSSSPSRVITPPITTRVSHTARFSLSPRRLSHSTGAVQITAMMAASSNGTSRLAPAVMPATITTSAASASTRFSGMMPEASPLPSAIHPDLPLRIRFPSCPRGHTATIIHAAQTTNPRRGGGSQQRGGQAPSVPASPVRPGRGAAPRAR